MRPLYKLLIMLNLRCARLFIKCETRQYHFFTWNHRWINFIFHITGCICGVNLKEENAGKHYVVKAFGKDSILSAEEFRSSSNFSTTLDVLFWPMLDRYNKDSCIRFLILDNEMYDFVFIYSN